MSQIIDGMQFNDEVTILEKCIDENLISVVLPESTTEIAENAFSGHLSLEKIVFNKKLVTIGDAAFLACKNLKKVLIPKNVTVIGENTFHSCNSLTSVEFETGSKLIGLPFHSFTLCTLLSKITIPLYVTNIHWRAFDGCINLKYIDVIEGNSKYKSIDGVLYDFNIETLIKYPMGRDLDTFLIPDSVTKIEIGAFEDSRFLRNVVIPPSVKHICLGAFRMCRLLQSINIPASVTIIEEEVFYGCSANLGIYTEFDKEPDNWAKDLYSGWNSNGGQVKWGYFDNHLEDKRYEFMKPINDRLEIRLEVRRLDYRIMRFKITHIIKYDKTLIMKGDECSIKFEQIELKDNIYSLEFLHDLIIENRLASEDISLNSVTYTMLLFYDKIVAFIGKDRKIYSFSFSSVKVKYGYEYWDQVDELIISKNG